MAEEQATPKKESDPKVFVMPLEWEIPPSIATIYANNVIVQYGENECYVLFFEGMPPFVTGTPEQMAEQYEKMKSVKTKCVARVALPRAVMPKVVKMLHDNQTIVSEMESLASKPTTIEARQ
jgi:hypothetical protein